MPLDTKKHIGVENILYFIYFSNQGLLGSVIGHWGMLERPQKFTFEAIRVAQKDIMGV
jgi:hypothetical protein